MIGLWHRWFDAREHRRAREIAERARVVALRTAARTADENADLRRANARLAVALADAEKAAALEDPAKFWRELADQRDKALLAAGGRVEELQRQLAAAWDRQLVPAPAAAPTSRDRENAVRLSDENARLRALVELCEKEHR